MEKVTYPLFIKRRFCFAENNYCSTRYLQIILTKWILISKKAESPFVFPYHIRGTEFLPVVDLAMPKSIMNRQLPQIFLIKNSKHWLWKTNQHK